MIQGQTGTASASTSTCSAEETRRLDLIHQQLDVLLHVVRCRRPELQNQNVQPCAVQHCRTAKNVLRHMLTPCTAGRNCGGKSERGKGLFPDTLNCGLRMRRECRERFPHHFSQFPFNVKKTATTTFFKKKSFPYVAKKTRHRTTQMLPCGGFELVSRPLSIFFFKSWPVCDWQIGYSCQDLLI